MSLFDQLVNEALKTQKELSPLRIVVEKELLHHDILREMAEASLLPNLTFMGGTCLRACYGSSRLSEDLDFTGGKNFNSEQLSALGEVLTTNLKVKYGLQVEVSEPKKQTGNVDTWKLKVLTHPEQPDIPTQRINIDICAIPSYEPKPMMLRNHYGINMGTSGLILQAESREEILANKLVALALRANRIKNRDLWDIVWLRQQAVELPLPLVVKKIADHKQTNEEFSDLLKARLRALENDTASKAGFALEMQRFLPAEIVKSTVNNDQFWDYLRSTVTQEGNRIVNYLNNGSSPKPPFQM